MDKKHLLKLKLMSVLVLVLSTFIALSTTVFAVDGLSAPTEGDEIVATEVETEDSSIETDNLEEPEILLEQYIEEMAPAIVQEAMMGSAAPEENNTLPPRYARYWKLGEAERNAYLKIRESLELISSGHEASTVVTVKFSDVFSQDVLDARYTAGDLGLESLVYLTFVKENEEDEGRYVYLFYDGIYESIKDRYVLDTTKLFRALLSDCPSLLYWFDKTAGLDTMIGWSPTYDYVGEGDDAELGIYFDPDDSDFIFNFTASTDYAAAGSEPSTLNLYAVDTNKTSAVTTSIENAAEIVADAATKSDYEKLNDYKYSICTLVSYDDDAPIQIQNNEIGYGNPWQLIYVFDKVDSTNVVCEGYAKAFKFLCDLTDFDNDTIAAHIVTGDMDGGKGAGGHMWNLVSIGDKNYLVDVTNCDSGTIGAPDRLFLRGNIGPVQTEVEVRDDNNQLIRTYPSEMYVFSDLSNMSFIYDEETLSLFNESERTLATSDYEPVDISSATITGVEDKTYTGSEVIQNPTVTITIEEEAVTLIEDEDYELSYSDNVNVGTATMTVTGIGDYTGTKTVTFNINADKTAPEADLSTLSLSISGNKTFAGTGDTVTVSVKVADESGLILNGNFMTACSLTYRTPIREKSKYILDSVYDADNEVLTFTINVNDDFESGVWELRQIHLADTKDNHKYINWYETGVDISAGNFTVSGTNPDLTPPAVDVSSMVLTIPDDKESATAGDTVTVAVQVSDQSDILLGGIQTYLHYRNPKGDLVYINQNEEYDAATGILTFPIFVTNNTSSGEWTLDKIVVADKKGNTSYIYSNKYHTQEGAVDLTAGDFTVVETVPDTEAPNVDFDYLGVAISSGKATAKAGDTVTITLKASDESGIYLGGLQTFLYYIKPDGGYEYVNCPSYNKDSGILTFTKQITNETLMGDWQLYQLGVQDGAGNQSYYYWSSSNEQNARDLSAGNFTVGDSIMPVIDATSLALSYSGGRNEAALGEYAKISVKVTDNVAVASVKATYRDPNGNEQIFDMSSGEVDNIYEYKFSVTKDTLAGNWTPVKIVAEDTSGNKREFNAFGEGGVITVHQHSLSKTDAKTETCTEAGNSEYWTCSTCGRYYSDEELNEELEENSWFIAARGHDYKEIEGTAKEPNCIETGKEADKKCSHCNDIINGAAIPALGHSWSEWEVLSEPTPQAPGKQSRTCSECNATETEEISNEELRRKAEEEKKAADKKLANAATVTLAATNYNYTGKVITPGVTVKSGNKTFKSGSDYTVSYAAGRKEIGRYAVTVKFNAAYGNVSKTAYFEIGPKAASISKPAAAKKAVTVKWKKQTAKMTGKKQITGYQVQLSPVRNFSSGVKTKNVKGVKKTSVKISGLKSKTAYYVRVRTYIKVGSKTYYSNWSSVKSVKAK